MIKISNVTQKENDLNGLILLIFFMISLIIVWFNKDKQKLSGLECACGILKTQLLKAGVIGIPEAKILNKI